MMVTHEHNGKNGLPTLKIGYTPGSADFFETDRERVPLDGTDLTEIAAAVILAGEADAGGIIDRIEATGFGLPIFVLAEDAGAAADYSSSLVRVVAAGDGRDTDALSAAVEKAAVKYESRMIPDFFGRLSEYLALGNSQFDCPGHQGGAYFWKHPAGRYFYDFYGEAIFRSDICNADVAMGDLLIHEGPPHDALEYAAHVFNANETFFVLNGTSTSNSVAIGAVVTPGDLVLFDRNNHKSVYDAALIKCGGTPVYLETSRNPLGFIGGIYDHCFDDAYLRARIANVSPEKADAKRPFRLAVIQLGTYDGTIYNARQVVDRIGPLCDYILFDSAWVGYEQFIPMMRECSPLLLELGPKDPGILVTQSVHKQQAGFSQASYLHKKDRHISLQKRYVGHERMNSSYRLYASTSPFYPLYASLDVNARMQSGEAGKKLWHDCVKLGIETRKSILERCSQLRPFVPVTVNGKPWENHDTDEIASDIRFFRFGAGERWHSFEGYGDDQYFADPNKLMLTTPGIDLATGGYEDFGVPATILAGYLRDHRIIPEKNDFNSILFLMTPAESPEKMASLVDQLVRFEELLERDAPVSEVLPDLYAEHTDRYRGYSIRGLCREMHDFYKNNDAKSFQQKIFRERYFPEVFLSAYEANHELIRNNCKLVRIRDILGEVALEGALPYPPGIFCVVPGERWSAEAMRYLLILEDGINRFPGFSPEIHGIFIEEEHGRSTAYAYVLDR
ncbi:MAG: ornithine decarboxylase [Clostridiales Family XIII bacterium]|jgi:ornithine decarboxylase|nr:ornithine decarboxylase [Clostridiales Family XIII bacterium]